MKTCVMPVFKGRGEKRKVVAYTRVLDDAFTANVLCLVMWNLYLTGRGGYYVAYGGDHARLHNIVLERYVCDLQDGLVCDHIDRNPLNNTPDNLRLVTDSVSSANRNKPSNNTSGFVGVSRDNNRWTAQIVYQNKKYHIGNFRSKLRAARAVNRAYEKLFPEVSIPNPTAEIDSEFYFGGDDLILT